MGLKLKILTGTIALSIAWILLLTIDFDFYSWSSKPKSAFTTDQTVLLSRPAMTQSFDIASPSALPPSRHHIESHEILQFSSTMNFNLNLLEPSMVTSAKSLPASALESNPLPTLSRLTSNPPPIVSIPSTPHPHMVTMIKPTSTTLLGLSTVPLFSSLFSSSSFTSNTGLSLKSTPLPSTYVAKHETVTPSSLLLESSKHTSLKVNVTILPSNTMMLPVIPNPYNASSQAEKTFLSSLQSMAALPLNFSLVSSSVSLSTSVQHLATSATPALESEQGSSTFISTAFKGRTYASAMPSMTPVETLTSLHSIPIMPETSTSSLSTIVNDSRYILNLPGCKMKFYKPFDKEVLPHHSTTTNLDCGMSFISANGTEITINKVGMANKWNINKSDVTCKAYEIVRGREGYSDNSYGTYYLEDVSENYNAKNEFLQITCTNQIENIIYEDFFAFILPKENVEKRCNSIRKSLETKHNRGKQLSVMFIGLDSVSHRNFIRNCPKTYKVLKENLDAFEFNGYTRLGSNTFPSLLPLLTGKSEKELHLEQGPYDYLPLIWKNFSNHGYRTLLAEDWPGVAIFNYLKAGFYYQPTDYYLRPFSLASENSHMRKMSKTYCFNSRSELSVNLNWCKALLTTFKNKPVFSFTFTTRLTHDYLNYAGYADEPLHDFVKWYKNSSARNNTFLVLFSDHGIRWGAFRRTDMGAQEESLPFFFLMVPPWFKTEHSEFYKNLAINQNRLMTMYDVREMLLDILNFTALRSTIKPNVLQRSISLFQEIPIERTCDDAAIPPEYCVCQERKHMDVNNPILTNIAKILVDAINKETESERKKCVVLKLQILISATLVKVTKRYKQNELKIMDSYKLTLRTMPGEGMFEGTVLCEFNSSSECAVQGGISRINKYGDQSICVNDSGMRNYCYCSS